MNVLGKDISEIIAIRPRMEQKTNLDNIPHCGIFLTCLKVTADRYSTILPIEAIYYIEKCDFFAD